MRVLLQISFPHEEFNEAVRDGTASQKIGSILEEQKPEAVYFTEFNGWRTAVMVVDLKDASQIPSIAEPWFLSFNADVEFHIAMTPEDLAKAGLEALGDKWG